MVIPDMVQLVESFMGPFLGVFAGVAGGDVRAGCGPALETESWTGGLVSAGWAVPRLPGRDRDVRDASLAGRSSSQTKISATSRLHHQIACLLRGCH